MPGSSEEPLGPRYARWVRLTHRPLDILSLVFLVVWLMDAAMDEPPPWGVTVGAVVYPLTWIAFGTDYVVRLWLSTDRRLFFSRHPLDLLLVLLPALRVLRGLRGVIVLLHGLSGQRGAVLAQYAGVLVAGIVVLGALAVYGVEHNAPDANITTVGDAMWWAVTTTTTVGYGDQYPVTSLGRIIASVVMLTGIGMVGAVSAAIAGWVVERRSERELAAAEAAEAAAAAHPAQPGGLLLEAEDIGRRLTELTELQQRLERRLRELEHPPTPSL